MDGRMGGHRFRAGFRLFGMALAVGAVSILLFSPQAKGETEDLRPLIYSHPLGVYDHGPGCTADARPAQAAPEDIKLRGQYPLYPNTVYAIEFSATTEVPEWDNQEVRIGFEDDGVYTESGCRFIDGRQTEFFIIR
jgi:hypothetical protein